MKRMFGNLSSLRYFYEVAQAGSFRAAAESMHIASSAINRQVTLLEEEYETPLFNRGRGRNGVSLTAAGQILMDDVKRLLDVLDHARTEIAALQGLRGGHIRIGINEGFSWLFFPEVLAQFNQRYPNIAFSIAVHGSLELVDLLLRGELEVVLAYNVQPRVGVHFTARIPVESYAILHKFHPLAKRKRLFLRDLEGCPLLLPSESLGARRYLEQMFARHRFKPSSVIESNSYILLQNAVAKNLGVAIMSSYMIEDFSFHDDVAFVPIHQSKETRETLSCCTHADRHLSSAALTIVNELTLLLQHPPHPAAR